MPVMTDYLHALEGRLRIKVPEVKGSAAAAARVEGSRPGRACATITS